MFSNSLKLLLSSFVIDSSSSSLGSDCDISFIEEKDKDEPLILVRRNEDTNRFYYTFHIIPEFTKDVVSGKYWVTVELYVNGEKLTLYPSITEIVDNGADAFGGQVRAFAGDIPYYDDEEF